MFWICLSRLELETLLYLLQRERNIEYRGEEYGEEYHDYVNGQKYLQELIEKVRFVLEHEK